MLVVSISYSFYTAVMKALLFLFLVFISAIYAAPVRTYPGSAAIADESQDADVDANRFEGVADTSDPVSGTVKRLVSERDGAAVHHISDMKERDDIYLRDTEKENWNDPGNYRKRACPHVREVNGVKRCIGSKGRREEVEDDQTFFGGSTASEEKRDAAVNQLNKRQSELGPHGTDEKRHITGAIDSKDVATILQMNRRDASAESQAAGNEDASLSTFQNLDVDTQAGKGDTGPALVERFCPPVRDVHGAKRCIGNKERRDASPDSRLTEDGDSEFVFHERFNIPDSTGISYGVRGSCATCSGKHKAHWLQQIAEPMRRAVMNSP